LMLDMSYVFSKSLDNSSGPLFEKGLGTSFSNDLAGFSDPYAWGRSEFDRRHTFAAFYAYDLPEYKGARVIRLFLNRWQIGGITQLRAGMPLDLQGPSLNGRPDVVARFRRLDPRRISTFVIDDGAPVRGNFLFDPTAFSNVDPNSPSGLGNLGRNVFSGPGLNLTSLSIVKRSRVADSQEIDVRADITNVFNHTNFRPDQVVTNKANLLFGQVYGALPARNIQLSVRYKFCSPRQPGVAKQKQSDHRKCSSLFREDNGALKRDFEKTATPISCSRYSRSRASYNWEHQFSAVKNGLKVIWDEFGRLEP